MLRELFGLDPDSEPLEARRGRGLATCTSAGAAAAGEPAAAGLARQRARADSGARVAAALDGAEVVTIRTADGDVGDKARFVRGIETALLAGEVDDRRPLGQGPPGRAARRGRARRRSRAARTRRDALVGPAGALDDLPEGARVGTSSLRRRSQLLALRPDLEIVELRGNVDTRLARLEAGDYDAIVLATAGLARLGRADEIAFRFALDELTPAPGQGCLALEAAAGDEVAAGAAAAISDRAALDRAHRRARRGARPGRDLRHPGRRLRALRPTTRSSSSATPARRTATSWVRDRVEGDPGPAGGARRRARRADARRGRAARSSPPRSDRDERPRRESSTWSAPARATPG